MSKWIEFHPESQPPGRKTKSWVVVAKVRGVRLGLVKWYASWRQYSFYPVANTLYERTCLRDLADFCDRETTAHFRAARTAKAAAKNEA